MQKGRLQSLENKFTFFALWFSTGNPLNLLLFGSTGGEEYLGERSNPLSPTIYLGICIVASFFLLIRWKQTLYQLFTRDKIIWSVIGLIILSTLWSFYPDITFRRAFILFMSTLMGVYFAIRYDYIQQLLIVCWAFGITIVMSFLFAVLLPKYGLMHGLHEGAWRGVYMHKNSLGIQMALSSILFLLLSLGKSTRKWYSLTGFFLSVALLFLARSSTAIITFLALALSLPIYGIARFRFSVIIPFFNLAILVICGVSVYIATNSEEFLALFGKDTTLTGRIDLWPYVWQMIQKNPWLGYGYEAFWRGPDSEGGWVWRVTGWTPAHSHNGLLELLLTFGFIGTSIFLLGLLVNFLKSLVFIHSIKTAESLWPVTFLSFLVLTNITEKNILGGGVTWFLYVSVSLLSLKKTRQLV